MSEQQIPLTAILDPEWNSRLWTESDAEKKLTADLAASMKVDGQLQAIEVEPSPGGNTYLLVIGSRRLRAAKLLEWTEIRANVVPVSDTPNRVLRNILENVKRVDLSSFEQARACHKLRELGLTGPQIGERLGFSKQKISNLAVSYASLTPEVLEEWRKGHPAATVDFLRELAGTKGKTPEETTKLINDGWKARARLQEKADAVLDPPEPEHVNGKSKAPPKDDPPFRVPYQRYFDLCKAIQKSRIAGGKLVIECLKYATGQVEEVKGVIAPPKEEEAAAQ